MYTHSIISSGLVHRNIFCVCQGWQDANRPFDGCMDGFSVRDMSLNELAKRLGVEEDEEDEGDAYCEVGEHRTTKEMMWPDFVDCKDCVNEKEYAEYMGISRAKALAIYHGEALEDYEDEEEEGECQGE